MTNVAGLIDAVLDMGYSWLDVFGEGCHGPLDHHARHLKNKLDRLRKWLIMSNNGDGMTIQDLETNFKFFKVQGADSREGVNGRSGIGEKALHIKVTNNQAKVIILSSPDGIAVNMLVLDYAEIKATNKFEPHPQEAPRRYEELYREYNGNSKGTVKILEVGTESAMKEMETLFESKKVSESILYEMSRRLYDYLNNGVSVTFQVDDEAVKSLVPIPPAYTNNTNARKINLEMRKNGSEERYYYGPMQYIVDHEKRSGVGVNGKDTSEAWGEFVTTITIVLEHTPWEERRSAANVYIGQLGLQELTGGNNSADSKLLMRNTIKRGELIIHSNPTDEWFIQKSMNTHTGSFHLNTTHEIRYTASDYTDRHLFHTLVNKSKLDLSEIYRPLYRQFIYHRTRFINEVMKAADRSTAPDTSVRRPSVDSNESTVTENPPNEEEDQVPNQPQQVATAVRDLPREWEKALGSGDNLQVVSEADSGDLKFMYRRRIHGDIGFMACVLLGAVRYLRENVYHVPADKCKIEWYIPEDRYDEVVGSAQMAIRGDRNGDSLNIIKI